MFDFLTSESVYAFLTGPMVWVAFIVFIGGTLYRFVSLARLARKDKVVYPYLSLKYALRSLAHWLIPFASRNMRLHPWVTSFAFVFHGGLLFTPLFLYAHVELWYKAWGIRWWSIPETIADALTIAVIACCLFFLLRRIIAPEVRIVSYASDYGLLGIVAAPFVTGFLAFHQILAPYKLVLILHIVTGELMLVAIPFTRLIHMAFFWLTRAHTGSEFGVCRRSKDY